MGRGPTKPFLSSPERTSFNTRRADKLYKMYDSLSEMYKESSVAKDGKLVNTGLRNAKNALEIAAERMDRMASHNEDMWKGYRKRK